jgi:hypothetical protein
MSLRIEQLVERKEKLHRVVQCWSRLMAMPKECALFLFSFILQQCYFTWRFFLDVASRNSSFSQIDFEDRHNAFKKTQQDAAASAVAGAAHVANPSPAEVEVNLKIEW